MGTDLIWDTPKTWLVKQKSISAVVVVVVVAIVAAVSCFIFSYYVEGTRNMLFLCQNFFLIINFYVKNFHVN